MVFVTGHSGDKDHAFRHLGEIRLELTEKTFSFQERHQNVEENDGVASLLQLGERRQTIIHRLHHISRAFEYLAVNGTHLATVIDDQDIHGILTQVRSEK